MQGTGENRGSVGVGSQRLLVLSGLVALVAVVGVSSPSQGQTPGGTVSEMRCPSGMKYFAAANVKLVVDMQWETRGEHVDAFCMDITEVTVDAYKQCVEHPKGLNAQCSEPACTVPSGTQLNDPAKGNWFASGRGNHPINCTTWNDAKHYCAWAGKRLPKYAEWAYAAVGVDGNVMWPWGTGGGQGCFDGGRQPPPTTTCPVTQSPLYKGMRDMVGNVWEWTSDGAKKRVVGGTFTVAYPACEMQAVEKTGQEREKYTGFRCAAQPTVTPPAR